MLRNKLDELTRILEKEIPPLPEEPTIESLHPLRDIIDAIDESVIYLLNERARCATAIGAIKKKLHLPVYTPSREEDVLKNVMSVNPGPLHDEAVRRLFERIIDETRALERHLYSADGD